MLGQKGAQGTQCPVGSRRAPLPREHPPPADGSHSKAPQHSSGTPSCCPWWGTQEPPAQVVAGDSAHLRRQPHRSRTGAAGSPPARLLRSQVTSSSHVSRWDRVTANPLPPSPTRSRGASAPSPPAVGRGATGSITTRAPTPGMSPFLPGPKTIASRRGKATTPGYSARQDTKQTWPGHRLPQGHVPPPHPPNKPPVPARASSPAPCSQPAPMQATAPARRQQF